METKNFTLWLKVNGAWLECETFATRLGAFTCGLEKLHQSATVEDAKVIEKLYA